jgi:hypothetical protein
MFLAGLSLWLYGRYEILMGSLRFFYAIRPSLGYAAFIWSPRRDRRQEMV